MLGSRAIYHDGWKAVTFKPLGRLYSDDDDPDKPFDDDVWELYHVADDFSECHDLASQEPERLRDLVDLWWSEAERNHVLPLDNRPGIAIMEPPPTGIPPRTRFVYRPHGARVPEDVAVNVKGRTHRIAAEVEIPPGGADGALLAQGSVLGGFSLFVQDGRLQYVHNYIGRKEHHLAAEEALTPGAHTLTFAFDSDGLFQGGRARLEVDGVVVAQAEIDRFTPVRFSITDAGLTCGCRHGVGGDEPVLGSVRVHGCPAPRRRRRGERRRARRPGRRGGGSGRDRARGAVAAMAGLALLVLGVLCAESSVIAVVGPRRPDRLAYLWFVQSLLTGELACLHLVWETAVTAALVALGALDNAAGWIGLVLMIVAECGLVVAQWRQTRAAPVLDAALRAATVDSAAGSIGRRRKRRLVRRRTSTPPAAGLPPEVGASGSSGCCDRCAHPPTASRRSTTLPTAPTFVSGSTSSAHECARGVPRCSSTCTAGAGRGVAARARAGRSAHSSRAPDGSASRRAIV